MVMIATTNEEVQLGSFAECLKVMLGGSHSHDKWNIPVAQLSQI